MDLKNQSGQTMVEYMLLLVVSISLVMTFLNSDFIKRKLGTGGELGSQIKTESQFAYRHAFIADRESNPDPSRENRDGRSHPSYFQPGGETRFFGPIEPYPTQ